MSRFKNFVSCHVHQQSLDSASTPEAFVKRELELGTGALVTTDHGTLVACRKIYDLAHADKIQGESKPKMIPVLGLEGYLRDDSCEILRAAGYPKNATGAFSGVPKYLHFTTHFQDQAAYECGVRLLSAADARLEATLATLDPDDRKHGSERKPLFTWADLEELGSYNVTLTSGCMIGAVQRHIMENNDRVTAQRYYEKMRSLVKPGNFYVEIFPHDTSKNWVEGVFITVRQEDGTELPYRWHAKKWVKTNVGEIQIDQLARAFKSKNNEHTTILAVKNRTKWEDLPPATFVKVEHLADFVPNECRPWAPDGDLQAGLNKIMRYFASKYGDQLIVGDDSHYAHSSEKLIQDIRLSQGGSWKFYGSYHRQSSEEAYAYFKTRLNTAESEFEGWVDNSYQWLDKFKGFKFDTAPSLPTKFYEEKYSAYVWSADPKVDPKDHSLRYAMELIKRHGRMNWKDKRYVDRLAAEIKVLHNNGTIDLVPYFFIDEEVIDLYERQGQLTGAGRGSAAGMLLAYVLGITHVDPIRYKLSMDRFITADRIRSGKLPDIDQDLSKKHRPLLIDPEDGWLKKRFGDHVAQISVDSTLKLPSAVKDVARAKFGRVPEDIEKMTKKFVKPPQGVTDLEFVEGHDSDEGYVPGSLESGHSGTDPELQEYVKRYPEHWDIARRLLGLSRQKGRHACAFVIGGKPIHEFIPLTTVSGVRCTSYTAGSVEAVGGVKMDFLGLGALDDLHETIQMAQARHAHEVDISQYEMIQHEEELVGWGGPPVSTKRFSLIIDGKRVPSQQLVPHNGRFYDVWDLPADQAVFADVATSNTETVFQFNTPSAKQWLEEFSYQRADGTYAIDSIESMAAFTALDRPGPLDMYVPNPDDPRGKSQHNLLVEYARRARGAKPSPGVLKIFDELVPETYGVMVFQEQLQYIYQQLTGCSGPDAEEFRSDVAKKKKSKIEKAYLPFIERAGAKIGKENAEAAWRFFITWAKYGFNASHAVSYAVTAYATAFLKHHFSLEWWTAVLRNADKNEVNEKFWQYVGHLIDLPDIQLSGPQFEIQNERIRAPLDLLHGLGEVAHAQLNRYAPYKDIRDFCEKVHTHRMSTGTTTRKLKKVKKKVPNPEYGNGSKRKTLTIEVEEEVDCFKKGNNALNAGVVRKMIFSGAMDGLFTKTKTVTREDGSTEDVQLDVADFLLEYYNTYAEVTGEKPEKLDPEFSQLNPLQRYQLKKEILPAYGEDLVPIVAEACGLTTQGGTHFPWVPPASRSGREVTLGFVTGSAVTKLNLKPIAEGQRLQVAIAAYVETSELFSFVRDGKRNEACKMFLDIAGARFEFVKWGDRKTGKVPENFKVPFTGAVIIAVLSRWESSRPFTLEDAFVVQPPRNSQPTEEKKPHNAEDNAADSERDQDQPSNS